MARNQEFCHFWEEEGLLSEDDDSKVTEPSIKFVSMLQLMLVAGDRVVDTYQRQRRSAFYNRRLLRCSQNPGISPVIRQGVSEFVAAVHVLAEDDRRVIPFVFCVHVLVRLEDLENRAVLESLSTLRMVPAAKDAVEGLKSVAVGAERTVELCVICMEEIGTVAKAMPCEHLFHGSCIVQWLNTSHVCPLCRFPLPTIDALAIESANSLSHSLVN